MSEESKAGPANLMAEEWRRNRLAPLYAAGRAGTFELADEAYSIFPGIPADCHLRPHRQAVARRMRPAGHKVVW